MYMETTISPTAQAAAISSLPTKGYAAQDASSGLSPWNFERRMPGPHDVQIEIRYCGVCHTDIHFMRNDWGFSMYPLVPGHEIIGIITQVGHHVTKFKKGDSVGVGCLVDSCRSCENCNQGLEQYCLKGSVFTYNALEKDGKTHTYGGYSNQIVVQEDFVLRVSDTLALEKVAPLLCAGITTYSPLKRWKISKGHKVGVLGLGGLGHMAVKFGAALGAEVTVLSTSPTKQEDAYRLGAHQFIYTRDEAQAQKVAGYFDFILDTVATAHDYNFYVNMLRATGTLICLGVPPDPIQIASVPFIFMGKSLGASLIGGVAETQEMLDFCAEHHITADVEVIDMKYIHQAFERMEKGDVKYRFVIDMSTL
jgi:uncharacterized zinc-type alcohol dehydrogenase-like protein